MDLAGAIIALVIFAPIMLVIALVLRMTAGSPVLFVQQRAGLYGKPFWLYKFRTMRDLRDDRGELLPDGMRLTRVGKFLRWTSLDELPELINVLRGEMSLVGPRPLFVRYLDRYSPEQARRHDVLPGLTGWAQVNGRNAVDWDERFRQDLWYVDHWSIALDLWILALTPIAVLTGKGVHAPGHPTMFEFQPCADKKEY
jgi:lipopolysaccharide/colanic/teichoic acid biosynthesis glycosyltransferase